VLDIFVPEIDFRTREYLTDPEVEKLMKAANGILRTVSTLLERH
jgi:hypothetical protein